jgi:hypothetical protein
MATRPSESDGDMSDGRCAAHARAPARARVGGIAGCGVPAGMLSARRMRARSFRARDGLAGGIARVILRVRSGEEDPPAPPPPPPRSGVWGRGARAGSCAFALFVCARVFVHVCVCVCVCVFTHACVRERERVFKTCVSNLFVSARSCVYVLAVCVPSRRVTRLSLSLRSEQAGARERQQRRRGRPQQRWSRRRGYGQQRRRWGRRRGRRGRVDGAAAAPPHRRRAAARGVVRCARAGGLTGSFCVCEYVVVRVVWFSGPARGVVVWFCGTVVVRAGR